MSNKKLSLLLHMDKGEPAVRTEGEEGEEAEGKGGDGEGKRDGGPGGRCPDRIKEGGDGIKDEESSKKIWGVGEAPTTSLGKGSVVLVSTPKSRFQRDKTRQALPGQHASLPNSQRGKARCPDELVPYYKHLQY